MKPLFSILLLILFSITSSALKSQDYPTVAQANSKGLLNSNICDSEHIDLGLNPASIAFSQNTILSCAVQQHYLISSLNQYAGTIIYPSKYGTLGIQYQSLSFAEYHNQAMNCVYAKDFSNRWQMGVGIYYHHRKYPSPYQSKSRIGINVGISINLSEHSRIGFSMFQIINHSWGTKEDVSYHNANAGVSILLSSQLRCNLAISSQHLGIIRLSQSLIYTPIEGFELFIGNSLFPTTFSTGLQIEYRGVQIVFATSWQEHLGLSPGSQLNYIFNTKKP